MSTTVVLPLLVLCCLFFSQITTETVIPAVAEEHPLQSQGGGDWFTQRYHDRILMLPGQPDVILSFGQYGGYVTVDKKAGRALFYYFVEAADPSFKDSAPLLLWLNGGPGCSSLGAGAMSEIGPFRVKNDGRTLYNNEYSWNKVANVVFLESPAGVGFSYSNTSTDVERNNDNNTAADSYVFLLNWMERFPEYKGRDFYMVGESYGGHYVPDQLAQTILEKNNNYGNSKIINLKGIALVNPLLENEADDSGHYEYLWSHAVLPDELVKAIRANCNFSKTLFFRNKECLEAIIDVRQRTDKEIDIYNIYAPLCHSNGTTPTVVPNDRSTSLTDFDPCNGNYVHHYLNLAEVQLALHAKVTSAWELCRRGIYDRGTGEKLPSSMLPLLQKIMDNGIRILVYSGDFDGLISFISTKNVLKKLNLREKVKWSPWKLKEEVVGYRVVYEGNFTFTTIKGAGHTVPSYKPEPALRMMELFLKGWENF